MTVVLPCGLPLSESVVVTSCTAVCAARAIEAVSGAVCGIKWVNDLYLDARKLGGILVESVNDYEKMVSECLIVGIGVNLTDTPEVTDSSVRAVSLREMGYCAGRDELCGAILGEILGMYKRRYDFSLYREEYRSRSIVLGHDVTFTRNGVSCSGCAEDITPSGGLIVGCAEGTVILESGEISLRVV
jgi:BirA family biotin operon repressor/biotin-[acetyl-CoA-carboxylase] ligase